MAHRAEFRDRHGITLVGGVSTDPASRRDVALEQRKPLSRMMGPEQARCGAGRPLPWRRVCHDHLASFEPPSPQVRGGRNEQGSPTTHRTRANRNLHAGAGHEPRLVGPRPLIAQERIGELLSDGIRSRWAPLPDVTSLHGFAWSPFDRSSPATLSSNGVTSATRCRDTFGS